MSVLRYQSFPFLELLCDKWNNVMNTSHISVCTSIRRPGHLQHYYPIFATIPLFRGGEIPQCLSVYFVRHPAINATHWRTYFDIRRVDVSLKVFRHMGQNIIQAI